jgi:hypothetical protein
LQFFCLGLAENQSAVKYSTLRKLIASVSESAMGGPKSINLDKFYCILFQVQANFFFIVMTTGQELEQRLSKSVFQCNTIMKCANEAKALHVRHLPHHYKPTTEG